MWQVLLGTFDAREVSLRNQKGKWIELVLVDELLNSMVLEELNYVNQASIVFGEAYSEGSNHDIIPLIKAPSPKEKACLAYKKEKGPSLFHFKPTFKWEMRSRVGEASFLSEDSVVETGRLSSDMGLAILSSTFLSGPLMGSSPALDNKDAGA
jgi:hypothetical protein